jgi:hypothetical protein
MANITNVYFVVRQKARASVNMRGWKRIGATCPKYCYYEGFWSGKHHWTKKLSNAWPYDAADAFKIKDSLRFNSPKVIKIFEGKRGDGSNKIIKSQVASRDKELKEVIDT